MNDKANISQLYLSVSDTSEIEIHQIHIEHWLGYLHKICTLLMVLFFESASNLVFRDQNMILGFSLFNKLAMLPQIKQLLMTFHGNLYSAMASTSLVWIL